MFDLFYFRLFLRSFLLCHIFEEKLTIFRNNFTCVHKNVSNNTLWEFLDGEIPAGFPYIHLIHNQLHSR